MSSSLFGRSGEVRCSTMWDSDGDGPLGEWWVIGGAFASVDGVRCYLVAGWDGERWHPIGPAVSDPQSSDMVHSMVVHQGRLVIGGRFNSLPNAQGEPIGMNNVAQLVNGNWQAFGSGVSSGGLIPVATMTVFNNELVIGGTFTISGQQGANVARWTGSQWSIVAGGLPGNPISNGSVVNGLAVFQGELYAGGSFGNSGLPGARAMGRYTGSGGWLPVGTGFICTTPNCSGQYVEYIKIEDGRLLAAGQTIINFETSKRIGAWDGTSWTILAAGPFAGWSPVRGIIDDAPLTVVGGTGQAQIWDVTGAIPLQVGPIFEGLALTGGAMEVRYIGSVNGMPALGGRYDRQYPSQRSEQNQGLTSLGAWDGNRLRGIGRGVDRRICDFVPFQGGAAAIGRFYFAAGESANGAAWFDGEDFHPLGGGFDGDAFAAEVHNGELYAGGDFLNAEGQPARHIARWTGSQWTAMGPGLVDLVREIVSHDGRLFARTQPGTTYVSAPTALWEWNGNTWDVAPGSRHGVTRLLKWNGILVADDETNGRPVFYTNGEWNAISPQSGTIRLLGVYEGQLHAMGTIDGQTGTWIYIGAPSLGEWVRVGPSISIAVNRDTPIGVEARGELYTAYSNSSNEAVMRWNGTDWSSAAFLTLGPASVSLRSPTLLALNDELLIGGGFQRVQVSGGTLPTMSFARWAGLMRPQISEPPTPVQTIEGRTVSFRTVGVGEGLRYRWYLNGTALNDGLQPSGSALTGTSTSDLVIQSVRALDAGEYKCYVSVFCSNPTAPSAVLTVLAPGCRSDWDNGEDSDSDDIIGFYADWEAGQADYDLDGDTDADDLAAFFEDWDGGC